MAAFGRHNAVAASIPDENGLAKTGASGEQCARATMLGAARIENAEIFGRKVLDAMASGAEVIQENHMGTFSSLMSDLVSTSPGEIGGSTLPLMTGPAMPKPAATMFSLPRCSAAWRENSLTMRSNCANSLLAKRCLKTGVSVPPFSEKSAKLHFVPPTSPARITVPPSLWMSKVFCVSCCNYGLCHCLPSRSSRRSDSRGPQLPAGYCGTVALLAALQTSRMGSTSDQAASTLSPRSKSVASPRTQSFKSVA